MAEIDDDLLAKRAELSASYLRRTTMMGFGVDIVVAGLFIIFKDSFGLGDIAYIVAGLLIAWGFMMLLIFPRLPGWGLRRYRRKLELADQVGNGAKEK